MNRYEDPKDPLNGPAYHTGKPCITKGCENPAGTNWGKFWCQPCNAARMNRISATLENELARLQGKAQQD